MKKTGLSVAVLFLLTTSVFGSLYFYEKYRQQEEVSTEDETKNIIASVAKRMTLPKETPTIATVSDISKLSDNPFFKNAQEGDKVLIFTENKRAILYRPQTQKIIDVTSVKDTVQNSSAGAKLKQSKTTPINKPFDIALYNGTVTNQLTQIAEKNLARSFPDLNFSITKKDNTKEKYEKTTIVNITGINSEILQLLKKELGAILSQSVPNNEATPPADILIILGEDYNL